MGLSHTGKIGTSNAYGCNRCVQTSLTQPSRTIYIASTPNRYFWSSYIVGVKNPRYLFAFFTGSAKGMKTWCTMVGPFKYNARDLICFQHNFCFLHIIFLVHYNNKGVQLAWWLVSWHATIGTWVRFPGPPKAL